MALDLQAEMQRLKDKLAISERTAKAEAQLKVKFYVFPKSQTKQKLLRF